MARSPFYNQNRNFTRGQVFMIDFPKEPKLGSEPSRLLQGLHRGVVLFDSAFPQKTVVVLPICSVEDEHGNKPIT